MIKKILIITFSVLTVLFLLISIIFWLLVLKPYQEEAAKVREKETLVLENVPDILASQECSSTEDHSKTPKMEYSISGITWGSSLNSNPLLNRKSTNFYIFVNVAVWNKNDFDIKPPRAYLVDSEDKIIKPIEDSWRSNSAAGPWDIIRANCQSDTIYIFDVPRADDEYTLVIMDNKFSNFACFDL